MRLYDECLLSGGKVPELITDGLFLWVDGRDAPANYFTLKNRVTNTYSLQIETTGSENPTLTQNGAYLHIDRQGTGGQTRDLWYKGVTGENAKTIEMSIGAGTIRATGFIIPNEGGYIGRLTFTYWDTGATQRNINVANSLTLGSTFQNPIGVTHVIATPYAVYINGIYHAVPILENVSFDKILVVRQFGGDLRPAHVELGTIRAYNRVLSAEEIMNNYKYELSLGRASK